MDNSNNSSTTHRVPMLSIGMPVYNGEAYIAQALDALLAQTLSNFELIISDNGSTDETQVICRRYAQRDQRIRYVRQIKNMGPVANFKYVLDAACADVFMWAAHDDLWTPDYLMVATTSLMNKSIDFVFPTFELKSIRLGLAKKFDPEIFRFVESVDRKTRILSFMALHYLSHSANIVYSVFRTEFLRSAWALQDIGNDGALGTVVLSLGRGALSRALFSKRYALTWPGMLPPAVNVVKGWLRRRNVTEDARMAIEAARLRMLNLYPEYEREIAFIFEHYRPNAAAKGYQICVVSELM